MHWNDLGFVRAARGSGGFAGWGRVLLSASLLLLCAPFVLAQGVVTDFSPDQVAQGYPMNGTSFELYVYFDDAFGGVPDTVRWVNAPGGPQNLEVPEATSYYARVIAPVAMTAALGEKQIQICRNTGSVCSNVTNSAKFQVVPPQVVDVYPSRVTRDVGEQTVSLSYVLPIRFSPSEPPTVYIVDSTGQETPLEVTYYYQSEGPLFERYVDVTVPATYFQTLSTYKFRVEEDDAVQGDFGIDSIWSTDASVAQATLQVVPAAAFVTASPLPPAQLGPPAQEYSTEIKATGGAPFSSEGGPEYDYYIYYTNQDDPPPAGLYLEGSYSPTTRLTGTPQGPAGKYSFTVYVQDRFEVVTSKVFRIGVQTPAPALSITTTALPQGTVGVSYSGHITATGGVPGYDFSIPEGGRGLPSGLELQPDGNVVGIPTTTGTFIVDVQAEDSQLRQAVRGISITIAPQFPPLMFSTAATLPVGEVGTPYVAKIEATGGATPVKYIVGLGLLPAGLSINEDTGVISGTPSTISETTFLATARDARGLETTRLFAIRVVDALLPLSILTPSPLSAAGLGENYVATILASGGLTPYSFAVSTGGLPPGLTLNSQTGVISGIATEAGSFHFTIRVASSTGDESVTRDYVLEVGSGVRIITQNPLPDGRVGAAYGLTFVAQSGTAPYEFSIIDGQLPNGITLDAATGALSGIPTAPFSGSFTLRVRDAATPQTSATRTYQIRILQPLELTVLELPTGTVDVPYQVQFAAQGGVTPYTFSLLSGSLPTGITFSANGLLSGTATAPATATLVVQVADANSTTAQRSYSLRIQPPPVSGGSLSLSTSVGVSNSQNEVDVTVSDPQAEEITGTVTLSLNSSTTPAIDDPAVQFIGGGRTAAFTIPAGQTSANFGSASAARFQTGTTAATLVFTAAFQRGGQDATPTPAPQATLTIPVTPPTLTDLNVAKNANTLNVVVRGFAPERNITTAVLEFTRRAGAPGNNPERFEVNVAQAFQQWFGGSASQPFGSQFRLTVPVTLTGDPADITGVTVRLTGPAGTGNSLTASF